MWEQKCSEEDWAVPWRSSTLKVSPPHLCLQSETTHFSLQLLFPFFLFFFFLFHFPFSFSFFLFPFFCPFFFLFLSPFHFFCPQPAVEIIWNHLSSLFSYWINSRNGINFSSVWWMLPKKLSSFCFVFLFFRLEYVLEEPGFSFLIDSRLFLPCFWSATKNVWYPFPPNRQPQTWRFFVFYPEAFSIIANLFFRCTLVGFPNWHVSGCQEQVG